MTGGGPEQELPLDAGDYGSRWCLESKSKSKCDPIQRLQSNDKEATANRKQQPGNQEAQDRFFIEHKFTQRVELYNGNMTVANERNSKEFTPTNGQLRGEFDNLIEKNIYNLNNHQHDQENVYDLEESDDNEFLSEALLAVASAEEYAAKIIKLQQACLTPLKEDLAEWLNKILNTSNITTDNFMDKLDNGVIICRLAKIISLWCEQQLATTTSITPITSATNTKSTTNSTNSAAITLIPLMAAI